MTGPDLSTDPRISGQLRRYHTWSVHREQTTAEHQWQTARILLAIYPSCDRTTLIEALFHDIGEGASGDPPYPVKRDNPDLKATMDRIEGAARLSMVLPWGVPPARELPPLCRWAVKLAEMIETWEFALQETMMGSRLAALILERNEEWLSEEISRSTGETRREVCESASRYMAKRRSQWQTTATTTS